MSSTMIEAGARSFEVRNESALPIETIVADPQVREIANQLSSWANSARAAVNRSSLFDRGAYAAPDNIFEQMHVAQRALENDDVVSSVAEITEGLAFQTIAWESGEPDEADIFDQLSEDLDLDSVVRRMWREEFAVGQVYCATWWGRHSYTVRGRVAPEVDPDTGEPVKDTATGRKRKGNRRRRTFDFVAPTAITIFDPTQIVPVGMLAFGRETLAYRASREEMETFGRVQNGETIDPFMETLFLGKYTPSRGEAAELAKLKVDPTRLLACDPRYVWKHTTTKADYHRFAPVRLKSTFRYLDLKQQMLEADRVMLIGAANYLLLVKKGEKDNPAQQSEIDNLNANFRYVAKVPVIVSDHRLEIEIVSPKQDFTLDGARYDTIDNRLLRRLLGTAVTTGGGTTGASTAVASLASRTTSRTLENRRTMLAHKLEQRIARAVLDHPLNAGVFTERPALAYKPRHIDLDINAAIVSAIQAARTNGEISRETYLEELGFDEAVEAQRRETEDEQYPGTFKPIAIPFSSPALTDGEGDGSPPKGGPGGANGGGRPTGGGSSTQNSTRARRTTGNGNPSTGGNS